MAGPVTKEKKLDPNLPLAAIAVFALFGTFMAGLGYAQWSTRGMAVYRSQDRT